MNKFKVGTLVIVAGGTVDKSSNCTESVSLCRIHTIGEDDLLVKEEGHYHSLFKVSKKLCTIVHIDPSLFVSARPALPELGDLVVAYASSRFSDKTKEVITGILYEISTSKGIPASCKILYDNSLEEATYTNLMVLQRCGKKE